MSDKTKEGQENNPYGIFNPDTKKWEGGIDTGATSNYIKKRQQYGDKGYGYGVSGDDTDAQRAISGSAYADEKKKWLEAGKSEEGFKQAWSAEGGEGTLGGVRHKARVDAALRAQAEEKAWKAEQEAKFGGLDEEGTRNSFNYASNAIKKNDKLKGIIDGSKGDAYGIKDLYRKFSGGAGYGSATPLSPEERTQFISGLEKAGVNPKDIFRELKDKSPVKRKPSPLRRNSPLYNKFVNPYAGNYTNLSKQIGESVDGAVQENRDRETLELEEARRAQQAEMQQLQLANLKAAQYETLNVVGDTGIKTADQYINSASRQMVDAQAANVSALKNGDIDTDQFAQKSAMIRSQIPALKKANEKLTSFQNNYKTLLEQDKISGADTGQAGKIWDAIQSGDIDIVPDESGTLMLKGITDPVTGEAGMSMPLSAIDRLPTPTAKAPEISEIAKGPLAQIGDGPWDEEAVNKAVDNLFGGVETDEAGGKLLKSFAVDQLGMTLEEANSMLEEKLEEPGDGGAMNALEQTVEDAIRSNVKTQYEAKKRKQEAEILLNARRQQQILLAQSQETRAQATHEQQLANPKPVEGVRRQEMNQNAQMSFNEVGSLLDSADGTFKFPNGVNAKKLPSGEYIIQGVGKMQRDDALKWFMTESKYDPIAIQYAKDTPLERKSPFSRMVDSVRGIFN